MEPADVRLCRIRFESVRQRCLKLESIPVAMEWHHFRSYMIEILMSEAHAMAPPEPLSDELVFDLLRNVPGLLDVRDADRTIRFSVREGTVMKCVRQLEFDPDFELKLRKIHEESSRRIVEAARTEAGQGMRR